MYTGLLADETQGFPRGLAYGHPENTWPFTECSGDLAGLASAVPGLGAP